MPKDLRRRRAAASDRTQEQRVKLAIATLIGETLRKRQMTQTQAAYLMNDAPSQVSLVVTKTLNGFSLERLLRMAARLGYDIDLVVKPTGGKAGKMLARTKAA